MAEINRYWFSKEQKKMEGCHAKRSHVRKVKVNGEWRSIPSGQLRGMGKAIGKMLFWSLNLGLNCH